MEEIANMVRRLDETEQREAQRGEKLRAEDSLLIGNPNQEFDRVKGTIRQLLVDAKEQFEGIKKTQRQTMAAAASEFQRQQDQQKQRRADLQTLWEAMRIKVAQILWFRVALYKNMCVGKVFGCL